MGRSDLVPVLKSQQISLNPSSCKVVSGLLHLYVSKSYQPSEHQYYSRGVGIDGLHFLLVPCWRDVNGRNR